MTIVWQRNGSELHHGDCLQILEELPKADLYLLDLPYGIALRENGRNGHDWTIKNDADQSFGVDLLSRLDGPVVAFASPKKPWPGEWRQYLVWDKGPTVGGGGDPDTCWKMTWELIQVRKTPVLNGKRDEAVLRYHVTQQGFTFHPCQKPLGLLEYLIVKTTQPGDLVVDLTCGSGSTILAAMRSGRRGIGVELDPEFCRVAKARLAQRQLIYE